MADKKANFDIFVHVSLSEFLVSILFKNNIFTCFDKRLQQISFVSYMDTLRCKKQKFTELRVTVTMVAGMKKKS